MTALVVLTVVVIVVLIAGPGVLPVLGRNAAGTDRRQPGRGPGHRRRDRRPRQADRPGCRAHQSDRRRSSGRAPAALRNGRRHRRRRNPAPRSPGRSRAGPPSLGHAPLPPPRIRRLPRRHLSHPQEIRISVPDRATATQVHLQPHLSPVGRLVADGGGRGTGLNSIGAHLMLLLPGKQPPRCPPDVAMTTSVPT